MTQGALFPIKVRSHQPARGKGRDLRFEAIGEDGMEWALKRQLEHPMLPASEFLCYRIAEACALAIPHCAILVDLDGAQVFGSRIEGGLIELASLRQTEVIERIASCAGRMSACFALDLVLGNEDRHFGNFLYRERGDGSLACMPIDWSRAWWVKGWPPQNVITLPCKTTTHIEIMRAIGRWNHADALLTLGTVSSIPTEAINRWLGDMPPQWLSAVERATLAAWWASPAFHERISQCVAYCK